MSPGRLTRRTLLAASSAVAALGRIPRARAQTGQPFRVGEISSYAADPAVTDPYRRGWEMAVARVNALGGINNRPLEFVSRDDGGVPDHAVQLATDLLDSEKVDLLAGGNQSASALALSAFAAQRKVLYVAADPLADALVWAGGNRYTYRVGPSAFMLVATLVEYAVALPAKTWATLAPDTDDGHAVATWFRQLLSARRPDVRFVAEQWPRPGEWDVGSVAAALAQPAPEGLFNALTGADLVTLVRGATPLGLFRDRAVASLRTGDPEYLAPLGADVPAGWLVTGFPWDRSDDPSNKQFVLDYQDRYGQPPTTGAAIGVSLVNAIASGLQNSANPGADAMAEGFAGASFTSPFGICQLRAIDHQGTVGTYVGHLAGRGGMVDWHYVDGGSVLPPDDVVRKLRPS